MASIDIIGPDGTRLPAGSKAPKGARYRARWRTPDGASRTLTFARKVDAEQHLATTAHRKASGEYIDREASAVTFAVYAERWLDGKRTAGKAPSTMGSWRSHLDRHLLPAFGPVKLRAIEPEAVEALAAKLAADLAPTYSHAVLGTLRAILGAAVDHGRLARSPARAVRVGVPTKRSVDPLHIAHVAGKVSAIADAMPDRHRAAVLTMASTGLRLGECLGLTVDRVDFLRRNIRVDRQLEPSGIEVFRPPKTRAGVRSIPVPATVTDLLAAHLAAFPAGEHGLIFTRDGGRALPRRRWSELYRAACVTAALLGEPRTHDLRHVAASSLIAGGLSVAAVQAVLGHSSPAETLEVYTHLWPTDEERTRSAIEAASMGWLRATQ